MINTKSIRPTYHSSYIVAPSSKEPRRLPWPTVDQCQPPTTSPGHRHYPVATPSIPKATFYGTDCTPDYHYSDRTERNPIWFSYSPSSNCPYGCPWSNKTVDWCTPLGRAGTLSSSSTLTYQGSCSTQQSWLRYHSPHFLSWLAYRYNQIQSMLNQVQFGISKVYNMGGYLLCWDFFCSPGAHCLILKVTLWQVSAERSILLC